MHPTSEVPFLSLIGLSAASFWRGAWYTMDATIFPDDLQKSCAASLSLGFGGFAALHSGLQRLGKAGPGVRGFALYTAALANIAAWRGVWLAWDLATETGTAMPMPPPEPEKHGRLKFTRTGAVIGSTAAGDRQQELDERRRTLYSGLVAHFSALALLVGVGHLCSAMAPPSRIGVLSDFLHHGAKPSKYLHDIAMFQNKPF